MKKLSRNELKSVIGGVRAPASCTAQCFYGSVTCSGSDCTASDAFKTQNGSCTAGGKTTNC